MGESTMFNFKNVNILKFFAAFSLIVMLAACSSSNDGIVFDPDVAPQNVQVVSGDDNTGAVRNTISWTRVPAATNYAVYFDNKSGVTDSSSKIVTSTAVNHVTHSGVGVVDAGNPNYYRIQALSGGESSILSDEVTGTPQESITDKALNDVAWNGINTLVAVGDAGIILNSPNGMADAWTDVSDINTTPESLTGVTWDKDNNQFLTVGAGLTVLSSSDGSTWIREDLSNLTNIGVTTDLEDVAWLGDQYIAVGKNGIIITSPDGLRTPPASLPGTTLKGVASDGSIIVAVGTNGTILTSPMA